MSKQLIYLEPRSKYDKAIVEVKDVVVYDYHKLINEIMDELDCDYIDAVDFFCFNIESVQMAGWPIFVE
tara:strand:+ start:5141 stop:5347 length:207 start_codon:yes stop_codon:yes gene_type:complete